MRAPPGAHLYASFLDSIDTALSAFHDATMYGTVALTTREIDGYGELLGNEVVEELRDLARPLKGMRVLNLSIASLGTSIADLLSASVPLFNDLGLDCHWQVVRTSEEFTHATKALYHALNGEGAAWDSSLNDIWLRYCQMNAELLDEPFDVVIVHDPQPAGLCACIESAAASRVDRWVWHCHMDLSHADKSAWGQLRPQLDPYDAIVFAMEPFLPQGTPPGQLRFIAPALDPLGPRNVDMELEMVATVLARQGIDPGRPLLAQVSPLDAHNDPLATVDAYLMVRQQVPDAQLLIAARPASDEEAALAYFAQLGERVRELPDAHLLAERNEVGNVEINVMQRAADVILQPALRRGFGLWLGEAQWKRRPVVAGPAPGAYAQIDDGRTGFIADTPDVCADRVVALIRDRALAHQMGTAARESVRDRYLLPRYLADTLRLLADLQGAPLARPAMGGSAG